MANRVVVLFFCCLFFTVYSGLVSISFGIQNACSREETYSEPNVNSTTAPFSCTAMSAMLSLNLNEPYFDRTIVSYLNDQGQSVSLNYSIRVQAQLFNSSIEIPVQYEKNIYNAYELYVPGESCAMGVGVGPCYDSKTRPPYTPEGDEYFVLCCLNHASLSFVRPNGAYCLRYNYDQLYEQYKFALKGTLTTIQPVTLTITMKGQTRTFTMNTLQPTFRHRTFGEAEITINKGLNKHYVESELQSTRYTLFRHGILNTTEELRWLLADQADASTYRLGMHPSMYKSDVSCQIPIHAITQTHTMPLVTDQFFKLREQTLVKHLESNQVIIPNTLRISEKQFIQNTWMQTIRANGYADQTFINFMIYDVN